MNSFGFHMMALAFRVRDRFRPRSRILAEVGLAPGQSVLDFGCGPGGYVRPTAELVGAEGRVWALDRLEVATEHVRRVAAKRGLTNVTTIRSYGNTGLPDASVDMVLLYDVFHHLTQPATVLAELHRVLVPGGVLSFSDHHMQDDEIVAGVTAGGLFELARRGRWTHTFTKV